MTGIESNQVAGAKGGRSNLDRGVNDIRTVGHKMGPAEVVVIVIFK